MTGFEGTIAWDTTKPNGQPRRSVDGTRARELFGFAAQTPLRDGIGARSRGTTRRRRSTRRGQRALTSRVFGSSAVLVAALALLVAYAWPEQPAGWNASAHFALVRALGDGTATIDPYRDETGDVGWYRGHYYTAKAPGLALYSLPLWVVLSAFHRSRTRATARSGPSTSGRASYPRSSFFFLSEQSVTDSCRARD